MATELEIQVVGALLGEKRRLEAWDETVPFAAYHEAQLAFAVGGELAQGGATVVVEAGYPAAPRDRCDVYADFAGEEWWIELKRGWHGSGPGWNSKPSEQLGNWLADARKLLSVGAPAQRLFVLAHYRQEAASFEPSIDRDTMAVLGREIAERLRTGEQVVLPDGINGADALLLLSSTLISLAGRRVHLVRDEAVGRGFAPGERLVYSFLAAELPHEEPAVRMPTERAIVAEAAPTVRVEPAEPHHAAFAELEGAVSAFRESWQGPVAVAGRPPYNYRQIRVADWPGPVHFELRALSHTIAAEFHLEQAAYTVIAPRVAELRAPLAARLQHASVEWDAEWFGVGRMRVLFPRGTEAAVVAHAMHTLVEMVTPIVADALAA